MKKLLTYILTVSTAILAYSCSVNTDTRQKSIPVIAAAVSEGVALENILPARTASSRKIIVAVIDTGVDAGHPDIKDSLWKDKSGRSAGWNFVDDNSDLTDNMGHGTHVAGLIKASGADISLMILKYYDPRSVAKSNAFQNSLNALRFAINNGADIINYSGGGSGSSTEELELLREAESKGIMIVTAAGNDSSDIDSKPYFPASYRLTNMITVASTDEKGELTRESNYGASTVDVAAPGEDIYSSLPGNRHGYLTGTSQATALVTGLVAAIKAAHPKAGHEEIKRLVLSSAVKDIKVIGKVSSGVLLARVNTGKLLAFH